MNKADERMTIVDDGHFSPVLGAEDVERSAQRDGPRDNDRTGAEQRPKFGEIAC